MPSLPDALLAAGLFLLVPAAVLGDWPLRLLIIGQLLVVVGLMWAWSDQR
jgi:hypothetical protein